MSDSTPLVLVVADHEDSVEMYTRALLAFGFRVLTAFSAEEGFARTRLYQPDVIVTDIAFGDGASGLDLARGLRADGRHRAKLLVLTGLANDGYRRQASYAGCDGFLLKPCSPDVLAAAIYDVIAGSAPNDPSGEP